MTAEPVITNFVDLYDVPALTDGQTIVKEGGQLTAVGVATQAELDAHAATVAAHPGAGVVLTWDAGTSDYVPTAAKAVSAPKEFRGPTDPGTVTGVVVNDYDVWVDVS